MHGLLNIGGHVKIVKNFFGRHTNFTLLSECIEDFFKSKNFRTSKIQIDEGCVIIAEKSLHEKLYARVVGNSDEFSVELSTQKSSDTFIFLGNLMLLFGGGGLFLRGMKSKELLERVESDFWRCVEEAL